MDMYYDMSSLLRKMRGCQLLLHPDWPGALCKCSERQRKEIVGRQINIAREKDTYACRFVNLSNENNNAHYGGQSGILDSVLI